MNKIIDYKKNKIYYFAEPIQFNPDPTAFNQQRHSFKIEDVIVVLELDITSENVWNFEEATMFGLGQGEKPKDLYLTKEGWFNLTNQFEKVFETGREQQHSYAENNQQIQEEDWSKYK